MINIKIKLDYNLIKKILDLVLILSFMFVMKNIYKLHPSQRHCKNINIIQ